MTSGIIAALLTIDLNRTPMRITRHPTFLPYHPACALTIGNFDGVHIGHRAVLQQLVQQAKTRGLTPMVMTFEPHPKAFFAALHNQPAPRQILPLRDKLTLLAEQGIEHTIVLPFNQRLAQMPAEAFAADLLVNCLNMRYLLIGDDFHFGAQRKGNVSLLQSMSHTHDFVLHTHQTVELASERVSSSAIRQVIAQGNLVLASQLRGQPLTLSGHVIYGQQLGRTINCPTINLKMPKQLAAQGIYAATVLINGQRHLGVASIGTRPSVKNNGQCWLEVHLFYFNQEVYGQRAQVTLLHKIRDEALFDGLPALKTAIAQDIAQTKAFFETNASLLAPV